MSMAGAQASRRTAVEREFAEHAREVAGVVAKQFQPVYERALDRAKVAEERAAVLQTCVERIALRGGRSFGKTLALQTLEQLGIVPDVQVEGSDGDSPPQAEA